MAKSVEARITAYYEVEGTHPITVLGVALRMAGILPGDIVEIRKAGEESKRVRVTADDLISAMYECDSCMICTSHEQAAEELSE